MPLLFHDQEFNSQINGKMILRRYLTGYWFLKPSKDSRYQSGTYLEKMWRSILKKRKKDNFFPKNILALGIGAGCIISEINKIWKTSKPKIDAIDYDPVMTEVAKTVYKNSTFANTNFITNDAADFIQKCDENKYDIAVIDLFCGNQPSPLLKNEGFIKDIKRILKNRSFIVLNFDMTFSDNTQEVIQVWQKKFPGISKIEYRTNRLLEGYAINIPDDYYDLQQSEVWSKFMQKRGLKILGKPRSYTNIQCLPFKFCVAHVIHSDNEPDINEIKSLGFKHGMAFWTPWTKKLAPKPWKHWPWPLHSRGNGFVKLSENYKQNWNERAKRSLKKFQSFPIEIKKVNSEVFIKGLKNSTLKKFLRGSFVSTIKKMENDVPIFWVAKKSALADLPKNEKILGGLAVINYSNISAHFVAFVTKEGKKFQAGTGLIDFWHQYALKNNIKYLNFGYIRHRGEPRSWQGYTDFKKNFIEQDFDLSNGYFRIF